MVQKYELTIYDRCVSDISIYSNFNSSCNDPMFTNISSDYNLVFLWSLHSGIAFSDKSLRVNSPFGSLNFASDILARAVSDSFIIYLFYFGVCCCAEAFSNCSKWGLLLVVVRGCLTALASLVVGHRL